MGIDPSIILRTQPIQVADPLERYGKSLALKNLMQQGETQDRAIADEDAVRQAYKEAGGDSTRLRALLQQGGQYKPLQALDRADLERREKESTIGKNNASADKSKADVHIRNLEHGAALLSTAKDQPTYENALRVGVITGVFSPEAVSKFPREYNPETVGALINAGKTETQRALDQRAREQQAETGRHNLASEANTVRGQNIGASTTRRGQDMTDTRQREANAVSAATAALRQRELESNLGDKDAARDQAVASYDTAIATLDRLNKHPGFKQTVGAAILPGQRFVPGTDAADFDAQLATFKAQTFLPMVQQLKGMGALSDAEGRKLSEAVGALTINMPEKAFKESITLIKNDLQSAKNRATRARSSPSDGKIGGVLTQNPDGSFNYGTQP